MEFSGFEYVNTVYNTLKGTDFSVYAMGGIKALAVGFLGLNLLKSYAAGSLDREGDTWGLKPKDIAKHVGSFLLIIFSTQILSLFDTFLFSIESAYKATAPPLIPLPLADIEIENNSGWDVFKVVAEKLYDALATPFYSMNIISFILSLLLWMLDIFIYPLFLAERFFLLGLMRVMFPIVITFSALEIFKDLQKKFYLLYAGVYLMAPAFFLVNIFVNKLYEVFQSDFYQNLMGDWAEYIPESAMTLQITVFIMLIKFKLYSKSHSFILKIFS